MQDALYIAAIGLQAQKQQLDASANNFANMNTPGFKRQSVDFSSLMNRPLPVQSGAGSVAAPDARTQRLVKLDMTPGTLSPTGRPLDIAVAGPGFLEVELADGTVGYARGGSLQVNPDGGLSLASGLALKADVRIPGGASGVQVNADGSVTAVLAGERAATDVGHLELASFANPEALMYRGDGIFTAPEGTPEPTLNRPGENGAPALTPGSLESSNVGMTDEMVALMLTERYYELDSRVAQAADEMMGMANNLRRS
jgi:flagellar basal-body rod protein FlgG